MNKYVRFLSHRARTRAVQTIGREALAVELHSYKQRHIHEISADDAEKIKGIKGVKILNKKPAGEWIPCW